MRPCQMAGTPCPREAVVTARIGGVGDRPVCQSCFETMTGLGMDVRALDPNAYVPEWRQRDLARDMTRVVA